MIPNTGREAVKNPRFFTDLLRRTLRLVCVIGSVPLFAIASAAGAAESQTLYLSCGGDPIAQLIPAGAYRTRAIDTTGRRSVTFETFEWACTLDNAKSHFREVLRALRTQEIAAGCENGVRFSESRTSQPAATPGFSDAPGIVSSSPSQSIPTDLPVVDLSEVELTPTPVPTRARPRSQPVERSYRPVEPQEPPTIADAAPAPATSPSRTANHDRAPASRDGLGVFGVGVLIVLGAIAALVALSALISRASGAARVQKERQRLARVQNIEAFVDEKMREISHAKRQLEREMRDLANDQR